MIIENKINNCLDIQIIDLEGIKLPLPKEVVDFFKKSTGLIDLDFNLCYLRII